MTNAEKFEEVFGVKPDTESMVIDCPSEVKEPCSSGCKYYEDSGCHCDAWWHEKYKGTIDYGKKIQKG